MLAVTGANGQLGRLVLKHLEKITDAPLRALVRSPQKAEDLASDRISLARADYDDPSTLVPALTGVDRLLLISGSEVGKRSAQHAAVIDAAKTAGVGFIVYTSLLNATRSSLILAGEHVETEKKLEASALPHVILRNGWYLENFTGTIASALEHGAVVGASGEGKFSAAGREDYAEAAAIVLAGKDTSNRILELAGHPAFSLKDLALEVSRQSGREIPFQNLSEEDYRNVLIGAGLPEGFAAVLADSDRGAAQGELFNEATTLQGLIGHPTKSLASLMSGTVTNGS
ncbi:SDR family oxidoreductase [Roseibium aggregatum]|uniref:SDR family oxidoreductase n=1 Tax=Roseibium aggregatum TaxID=187304 RepID=A0A939EDH1_9HYPH|nr:SDR family oxidoreductase [Roseibium aggregatum]MBN9671150.1 SDR family oxidoreductase [Roseibium aggregatum]